MMMTYIAGEDLSAYDWVTRGSDGKIYKATNTGQMVEQIFCDVKMGAEFSLSNDEINTLSHGEYEELNKSIYNVITKQIRKEISNWLNEAE